MKPFKSFLSLTPVDAVVLVRAARQYQQALWVCDSEPHLAWLMLVSSVESAAQRWRAGEDSNVERLRAFSAELAGLLVRVGGQQHFHEVADLVAPRMGATKTFVNFLLEFLPEPPATRPPDWLQLPWSCSRMRKEFKLIYDHRSRALHGGKPFPYPACVRPMSADNGTYAEVNHGGTTWAHGGVWRSKDVPMLLRSFAYVVRGALLGWWASLHQG